MTTHRRNHHPHAHTTLVITVYAVLALTLGIVVYQLGMAVTH